MHQFIPYFQPILEVSSGNIVGYETLAREKLADSKVISAGPRFSNPEESPEFLLALDRHIRQQALQRFDDLPADTFISLNISPTWIEKLVPDAPVPTIEMLSSMTLDPRRLVIEITESEGDMDAIQRTVARYRELGMRIAIDDFGAGYSEIGRLIALEPDLIKLDMRFFKTAIRGGITYDAVRAISFMAERIGADILCEGVETAEEFEFAMDCGATLIQGYLFYHPGPDFVAPYSGKAQIASLRQDFLDRKIHKESDSIRRHMEILEQLSGLSRICADHHDCIDTALLPEAPPQVLRFYICDYRGNQLSPNYEYINGQWSADTRLIGFNWSGRPYFYQLIALQQYIERQEITSRPYRDRYSRELCQTTAVAIDHSRILLIDYLIGE